MKPDVYIMRMSDTGYDIVGPFESHDAAGAWGSHDQEYHRNGDPRWQTIELVDPHAAPSVINPHSGLAA